MQVLKKHVGAVHVRGQLSLLQRKVANVLLLNAYEDLPRADVHEHTIRVRTLAEAAGFGSNDHHYLRETLEALVSLKVQWNALARDGEEEWGVASFLAQAVVRGGTCRYAYAPDLRKKLYNPEIYARINLAVQERFGSAYALALYENCVRFRKVGTTGWIDLDAWRGLLGVEQGQYAAFKYLNRDVLKPAVDEVNRHSDIRVAMETRREHRRVVALKFSVADGPAQLRLELAPPPPADLDGRPLPDPRALAPSASDVVASHPLADLQRRLLDVGLSEAQALDVSTEFARERVEANLDFVEAELARGRLIQNVPAFTITAVRHDYCAGHAAPPPRPAPHQRPAPGGPPDAPRTPATADGRAAAAARAARFDEVWAALTDERRAAVLEQAAERLRSVPFLHRTFERERAAGTPPDGLPVSVRTTLRAHCADLVGCPLAPDDAS